MGSWQELDARYEPGKLTPALAFVVALVHMAGADGVYLAEEEGALAAYLPRNGLGNMEYDTLIERAEAYLQQAPLEQFLEDAPPILNREQKLCILVNMLDTAMADGNYAPEEDEFFQQTLAAFAVQPEDISSHAATLRIKHSLGLFEQ